MEYMEDCIHLHACRRLCKMHKIKSRGCNDDCTAYQTEDDFIPPEPIDPYGWDWIRFG